MATRRKDVGTVDSKLSSSDPRMLLAPEDYAAVKAAGTDADKLAAILEPDPRRRGTTTLRLAAGRVPYAEQPEYVLRALAGQRRRAAIHAWAEEHSLDRQTAITYFYDASGRSA